MPFSTRRPDCSVVSSTSSCVWAGSWAPPGCQRPDACSCLGLKRAWFNCMAGCPASFSEAAHAMQQQQQHAVAASRRHGPHGSMSMPLTDSRGAPCIEKGVCRAVPAKSGLVHAGNVLPCSVAGILKLPGTAPDAMLQGTAPDSIP